MTRFYIHRGRPEDAWSSFTGGSYGIPNRGYYLQAPAALRAAEEIARARGEPVYVTRRFEVREGSETRTVSSVYAQFEE